MVGGGPDKPKKTAEEKALETRQRSLLDEEIKENEERFKLLAKGTLGRGSLLSGAARTTEAAAGGARRGGAGGAGSLLSGGAGGGTSTGGSGASRGLPIRSSK